MTTIGAWRARTPSLFLRGRSISTIASRSFLVASTLVLALLAGSARAGTSLGVVTYNIHSGLGPGRAFAKPRAEVERNLRAVAADVAAVGRVDVVALNEVDFESRRSGWIDQAAFVAEELRRRTGDRFTVVRGETWRRRVPGFEVSFGNAVLARRPVLRAARCLLEEGRVCESAAPADDGLPSLRGGGFWGWMLRETRGVISVTIDVDGRPVEVLATHLDAFVEPEREAQAAHLLARWVAEEETTILLGDMNAVPAPMVRPLFASDRTAAILTGGGLRDAQAVLASSAAHGGGPLATFPSAAPRWPLDWVLGSVDLVPEEIEAIGGEASDHLGLYVRYRLSAGESEPGVRLAGGPEG